jgi:hypothetical protein
MIMYSLTGKDPVESGRVINQNVLYALKLELQKKIRKTSV